MDAPHRSPHTRILPFCGLRLVAALSAFALAFLPAAQAVELPSSGKVDFSRDIRPILSNHCYYCHGPDEAHRKAKLRLDTKGGLFSDHDGSTPVIPGNVDDSEAWLRVISTDKDDMMPPPEANKALKPEQIALLKRWIEQGASYSEHWSFTAPKRPALPPVANAWWGKNAVDRFIAAELEEKKLPASPEAPKEILLRRASYDLTGLPPSLAEMDTFLADTAPDAYDKAVDRLLATPRFGEHMARYWLDAVRYGDTHGLHLDNERSMWPYRDWVVRAFNQNLPYDKFTVWQIAGDLLPKPTRDELIASGYNRCNVTTSEGGSINEELLFRYAVDRTETTVALWMGLTAGCAVCHDHKFDPIPAKDFYSLYSFFNSAADPAMDGNVIDTAPVLRLTTPEQEKQLGGIEAKIKSRNVEVDAKLATLTYTDPATLNPPPPVRRANEVWVDDWFPDGVRISGLGQPGTWISAEQDEPVKSGNQALKRSGEGITQSYFDGLKKPYELPTKGKIYAWVWLDPKNPPKAVMLQWHSGEAWSYRANWGDKDVITFGQSGTPTKLQIGGLPALGKWVKLEVPVENLKLKPGTTFNGLAFTQYGGTAYWDLSGVEYEDNPAADPAKSQTAWEKANQGKLVKELPKPIQDIFRSVNPKDRKPEHFAALRRYYLTQVWYDGQIAFAAQNKEIAANEAEKKKIESGVVKTLIMGELPEKRPAHIMVRGQYDKPGELVKPATLAILPPLTPEKGGDPTRLDFANSLIAAEHPLMARVAVNRFWQQFFGTGIVKTAGDFGAQGAPPSHPELLDWLAVEFRESGWDVKKLVKLLVTSAAYRQDSRATPALLEADPENRLYARGPRFRLDGEEVRDSALYVGGLLDQTIGGKGVKPYQPEKIWEPVGFVGSNTREYQQDHGSALYRRSLYTFWKRTAPPPSMTSFDAPSREQYCTRREKSNTPLQALVTLNDVQFFEAARALAQRMMTEGGIDPADRIQFAFRTVTGRRPQDDERDILKGVYEKELARYAKDTEAAKQVASAGESPVKQGLNPAEVAAWTLVANTILNMDEALVRN